MLTTADLLAAAKAAQGIPSNYRLARTLDVPEKTVQGWNTGKHIPSDRYAATLAQMAGIDVGVVMASFAAQRASDDQSRSLWEGVARRLERAGLGGMAAVLLSAGFIGGGGDAQAASALTVASRPQSVYYVN